jgi:hypothetical protein
MSYPVIPYRRIPYDIDGTSVGYRVEQNKLSGTSALGLGVSKWLASADMVNLNSYKKSKLIFEIGSYSFTSLYGNIAMWFVFPEERNVAGFVGLFGTSTIDNTLVLPHGCVVQGSRDSTNGMDGTWETASLTGLNYSFGTDAWRYITKTSFSTPIKAFRIIFYVNNNQYYATALYGFHLYGSKATGQTPDDIIFCDQDGVEITSDVDWGDVSEGTTQTKSFYIKNVSTKTANNINIDITSDNFTIGTNQATWGTSVNIATLAPGQISQPLYTKLTLPVAPTPLLPKSERAIVTVTSWT